MINFYALLKSKKQGFSILEVVVVIVVIGFFAMLIIPGLISGPSRARDASRKSDLKLIGQALENYYHQADSYPTTLSKLEGGATPYIKKVPKDPKSGVDYIYITVGTPPSSFTLDTTLENKNDKDLKNMGNDAGKALYRTSSIN